MTFVYTYVYACLHLSIPCNFLTQLTNFNHITNVTISKSLKFHKISLQSVTVPNPWLPLEQRLQCEPNLIRHQEFIWKRWCECRKKLQSEYPSYYTSEDLIRRQIQRNSLLTELPFTFSEVWLFFQILPLLLFPQPALPMDSSQKCQFYWEPLGSWPFSQSHFLADTKCRLVDKQDSEMKL